MAFVNSKKKNFAHRGTYAEDTVGAYLKWWESHDTHHEANRLLDTKAAGRIVKAAKGDFDYFAGSNGTHGLIEVKQTEHDYRLQRSKVPQLPSLRKREKCGGRCFVVVYHSNLRVWRALTVPYLMDEGDKGSWNLMALPTFDKCCGALAYMSDVFPAQTK